MPDNALGLPDQGDAPGTTADPFADSPVISGETAEPDAGPVEEGIEDDPTPVETPPPTQEPTQEPTETQEAEGEEQEPEPETAEDSATALETPFLGKYETEQAAEQAFNEIRRAERRQAEENRLLTELLREAGQRLQAQPEQPQPAQPTQESQIEEMLAKARADGMDEDTLRLAAQMAQAEVTRQMEPLQGQIAQQQQQFQQSQEQAQAQAMAQQTFQMIQGWKATQTDLDAATEERMVGVFEDLDLDEKLTENYPLALEIARSPALHSVVMGLPSLVDTDQGMEIARRMASETSDTQTPRAARNTPEARRQAHVESGPSGATPPGTTRTPDLWEQAMQVAKNERQKVADSPLGV